jgi:hypothetical protein
MRPVILGAALAAAVVLFVFSSHYGCGAADCRSGSDDCMVATPCPDLSFTCEGGFVRIKRIASGDDVPGGLDALSAVGDILIENDRIELVIDAVDHPNFVAASGGAILDLATRGGDDDSINHIFQATGLLPEDAARYTAMEVIEDPGAAIVTVRGHLDGKPDQKIATRYEVRPCEPGVRVRTEYVNLDADDAIVTLADGWYWSGRGALPFTPIQGIGFEHESFGLSDIQDVYHEVPLMAASGHTERSVAYATVACSAPFLEGFQSNEISAIGSPRRVFAPRSSEVLERFIAVAAGRSIGPAVDVALEIRKQLFGEAWINLMGRVTTSTGSLASTEVRASVHIARGTAAMPISERTPLTQVIPDAGGAFSARVPAGGPYVIEVSAFGRVVATKEIDATADFAIGDLPIEPSGVLTIDATVDGVRRDVLVLIDPADDETQVAVASEFLSNYDACAPLLGPPHGGSPACNRVLVKGPTRVELPPGRFSVYATAGLLATIARETIDIGPGDRQSIRLQLESLPLLGGRALSADFHVHGGMSFDSSIPDRDRVRAFLASSMDVIVATDHDVIHDYSGARAELSADERLVVVTGLETTGQVLFDLVPGSFIPRVIGHYNFWPLEKSADLPRRGAPYDDKIEPGTLFTRMEDGGLPADHGVRQLNHPWANSDFGRDLGFPRAIEVEIDEPLPQVRGNDGASLFLAKPANSRYANSDYHVQEVMNGTNNEFFAADRAFWFYLLNQGIVRAGTANSDSHGLTDNVLGTPRNIVFTETTRAGFDVKVFNADVKAGRMLGTNGPIIDVRTTAVDGTERTPSVEAFAPAFNAVLAIRVTAAPWVPVEEIRIVVNGEVARTITDLPRPASPFGKDGLLRYEGTIPLADLLPAGDAWIVVEAGDPLPMNADLDCNGVPDTGDNDGNGVIDWRDAEDNESEPAPCDGEIGPLARPKKAERDTPHAHYEAVTPDGAPAAFTNPLIIDRDGNGYAGVGR